MTASRVCPASRAALLWPVVAILLLAAGLRVLGVADRPVWTDEGWGAHAVHDSDFSAIWDRMVADRHPPLYFLALGGWWKLAGPSRIALRFPSIAAGLLAVAVTYRLGADWFGRRAARYGALLLAVLPLAVYYSQEIRHYGWLMLAVSLMTLLFLRYLRRPRPALAVAYALSIALMLYTLYLGLLVLAVHGAIGLLFWRAPRRHRLGLVAAWIAAFALFAPWLAVIVTDQWADLDVGISGFPGSIESDPDGLLKVGELVFGGQLALTLALYVLGVARLWRSCGSHDRTLGGEYELTPPFRTLSGVPSPAKLEREGASPTTHMAPLSLSWMGKGAGGIGVKWRAVLRDAFRTQARDQSPRALATLTVIAAGGGLLVFMFVGNLWFGMVSARMLAYLAPAVMLVCGVGLATFERRTAGLLAGALVIVVLATGQTIQPRLRYDDAARAVGAGYSPGDLVVLEAGWDDNAFWYEVLLAVPDDDPAIIRTLPWVDHTRPERKLPVVDQLAADLSARRRVWVVQWLQPPELAPYLDAGGAGFRRVWSDAIPTGPDYTEAYPAAPTVQVALYERPDLDGDPVIFGETLALRDAVLPAWVEQGAPLHVDLWWSAHQPPLLDYSVGVYLLPAGDDRVIDQHDAPPGAVPTTAWEPDAVYFDRHTLELACDLPPGAYRVAVGVYWFGDGDLLPTADGPLAVIGEVQVR